MKKTILVAALLFMGSAALAEDTTPTTPAVPTAIVAIDALKGLTVTFVDEAGTVVATLNPDGTLNPTGDLATAKKVVLTNAEGVATSYDLAGDLSKPGQVKVLVDGKALPITAAVNKAKHEDKVTGKPDDKGNPGKGKDADDDSDDDSGDGSGKGKGPKDDDKGKSDDKGDNKDK